MERGKPAATWEIWAWKDQGCCTETDELGFTWGALSVSLISQTCEKEPNAYFEIPERGCWRIRRCGRKKATTHLRLWGEWKPSSLVPVACWKPRVGLVKIAISLWSYKSNKHLNWNCRIQTHKGPLQRGMGQRVSEFTQRLEVCMFLKRMYDLAFKTPMVNVPYILVFNCHHDFELLWGRLKLYSVYFTQWITKEP